VRSERITLPLRELVRIASRDGWKCHVCSLGFEVGNPWEVDHDKPLARGGTNHLANLRLAHRTCNREKAAA
jgi:5-methylcytosine-specific restriction endonuclease McrA